MRDLDEWLARVRSQPRPELVSLSTVVEGWDHEVSAETIATVARGIEAEQARLCGSRVLLLLDWSELGYDHLLDGLTIHSGYADVTIAEKLAQQIADERFNSMLEQLKWKDAAREQIPATKMWPDSPNVRVRTVYNRRAWDGVGWHALEARARLWSCDPQRPIGGELIALLRGKYRNFDVIRHFERAAEASGQGRAHT